jgi:phosphatidylserine/phosphatidylglycerophosphate/cardiolipin synthase-like enzyme
MEPMRTTSKKDKGKLGWKEMLLSLFLIVVVWAGQQLFAGNSGTDSGDTPGSTVSSVQVYFTTPRYPDTASYHYGGLDEKLASAIDIAEKSVDVAAYDFDLARVADALVRAHQRGIAVRVVAETDYEDELGPQRLLKAKVPMVFDERGPFMHNKYIVIDGRYVWTGSWNFTDNGTYRNNNNVVIVDSKALAENYTTEFEEMFLDKQFGVTSPDNTPNARVIVSGVKIDTIFESEGNARDIIVKLVQDAQISVNFMVFVFTDDDIARAVINRHRAGVPVRGVVEARNLTTTGSNYETMRQAGVEALSDGNPYIMHHKVIIIDEAIVVTGSYNFTNSAANSNDENVLIIHSPEVAAMYMAEFERVYAQAKEAK